MSNADHWHYTTTIGFSVLQGSNDHELLLNGKELHSASSGYTRVSRRPRPVPSGTRGLDRSPDRSRIPAPDLVRGAFGSRAPVSLRSRASRRARGRAILSPVSVDRTRGNDAGALQATFPEGG